jgi:hypothetical protein
MVSYIFISTLRSSADVGYLITVPPYEQFYVMVHTIKLLLHYALDRQGTASDLVRCLSLLQSWRTISPSSPV